MLPFFDIHIPCQFVQKFFVETSSYKHRRWPLPPWQQLLRYSSPSLSEQLSSQANVDDQGVAWKGDEPAKFAPAFGGFCAMGGVPEKKPGVNSQLWRVVQDKLYLNVHGEAQPQWWDHVMGQFIPHYIAWGNQSNVMECRRIL